MVGDLLMHTNLSRGAHAETFLPDGWTLFDVPWLSEEIALARMALVDGMPYDIFSQLAFVVPNGASDSSRLYCYEMTWFLLTGEMPQGRITPEDLLTLIAKPRNESNP